jgi:hypothetical protein
MTSGQAERAVVTSAVVVAAVYAYRSLTEGTSTTASGASNLLGIGAPAQLGRFVTAWGFTFFVLSLLAEAAPGLGGSFAILAAVTDIMANIHEVGTQVNSITTATKTAKATTNSVGAVSAVVGGTATNVKAAR